MKNAPVTIYNASLELVAYLENATGIGYKKRKGEVWSASFCLPADDPKNDECKDFYYAEIFDGDTRVELFRIILNRKSRIKGKPVIKYECKHVLSTLNDSTLVGVHNAGPGVEAALNYVLGKQVVTHWQLGTVDFVQNFYHYWKDLSLLAALYTVSERFLTAHLWTFDTKSYPWTLNLLEAPTAVSARIAYRKNMQQIDRKSDVRNLYTRLYPYGYGAGAAQVDISGIDLAAKGRPGFTSGSVEFTVDEVLTGASSSATAKVKAYKKVKGAWGDGDAEGVVFLYDISGTFTDGENLNGSVSGDNCATLDSSLECVYAENVTKYGVITRKWEDQRYTIAANLYDAAEEKVDAHAIPELTYALKAADLHRLTGRGQFVLGDLVKVYDEPLRIDVDERIVTLSKKDVKGKPGDLGIQLGNAVEKFPDFGRIVYADDLDQVKDGTKWGRVLSTQILAGEILLSAVPGSTVGAFPATPTVAGLYVGATHFGFHDGTNWITYTDIGGKAMWEGIGGDSGHIHWDPAGGGSLDIKGAVTITAGAVGGFNVDPTEGLYIGTGATRVQMKPGAGMWCGATAFADAPWRVSPAGAVTCTNLTITGGSININSGVFTVSAAGAVVASSISCTNLVVGAGSSWGGNVLGTAYIPNLSATKITTDTMSATRISGGTIGACTISAAYLTTGILDFAAISRTALSVLNTELAGSISSDKIASINADVITAGTLDAGVVNIVNLTVTGVITCQAGSSYVGNAIGTAYTAAKCPVANADHTADIVNAMAYRSDIRAVDCDTTIISGGKIITGLLTANNITAGTMAANRISGGTIGACMISADNITTGSMSADRITTGGMNAARITAGTMSVGRITIDQNVNFKPNATLHKLYGVDTILFGPDGLSSGMKIGRSASGGHLLLLGNEIDLTAAPGHDISLISGDNIVIDVADADYPMYIKDWVTAGGAQGTAAGRITLMSNGITRYLRLYT